MALAFLRHLKPEALRSRKKFSAPQAKPVPSDTGKRQLEPENDSPIGDLISPQDFTGEGQPGLDEEHESGICTDASSECSRRGSNDSQETDQQSAASLSTNEEDFEDGQREVLREVAIELDSQFPGNQLDDAAGSDITASDARECPVDAEEDGHDSEIHSSYADTFAESSQHDSESLERSSSVENMTGNLNLSMSTFYPEITEEMVSETEQSSYTTTPPAFQDGDEQADDTDSCLSDMNRRDDSITESGADDNSYSNTEERAESPHPRESYEAPGNAELSPSAPALPPPAPPPPPPLGLLLPGDHTTSSTTDYLPTSKSVSMRELSPAAEGDEETSDSLMWQIQAAARKMSNQRETLLTADKSFPVVKSTPLLAPFTADLKSVLEARQKRNAAPKVECVEIPGKSIYYKSRIGIPPEETELCRVFLRRAAKASPENTPEYGAFDDNTTGHKDTKDTRGKTPPIVANDREPSSVGDTEEVRNSDEINSFDSSAAAEIPESRAIEPEDLSDTLLNDYDFIPYDLSRRMVTNSDTPLQNELLVEPCPNHTMPSTETEGKEFDQVVEDFDQFLEDNVSAESFQDLSESSLTPQALIQVPPVSNLDDTDEDLRNGDVESSKPAHANILSSLSSSALSPNLSYLSEDESPVFEEMDEEAISMSAQTVHEHSKLLAKPLESYNILPTIKEIPAKKEVKTKFSFRNAMASVRNTVSSGKRRKTDGSKSFSVQDEGQMKVDDNWSIHDTLRKQSQTLENHDSNKLRSLKDVFANCEVRSFSEYNDPDQNSGKDFSVRNWAELMERSSSVGDVKHQIETEDDGEPTSAKETGGYTEFLTRRASSSSNLGSLGDTTSSSQADKLQFSAVTPKSNHAAKKTKVSKSKADMEDLTSDSSLESPSRHASSCLSSTLPSRRHRGMIQSFDSIYPAPPSFDQRRYQKKTEPRKYSLPAKVSAMFLTPVQRRQQRSQQAKR